MEEHAVREMSETFLVTGMVLIGMMIGSVVVLYGLWRDGQWISLWWDTFRFITAMLMTYAALVYFVWRD
jgi:hypothetical protein